MLLGALAAAVVAFLAWAVRGRSSGVFGRVVWRGPRELRVIALTFDDGPSDATPELLGLLASLDVRATFFLTGTAVERLPDIARSIARAGHEIASHGYSHAPLYLRGPGFVASELDRAQEAIRRVTGVTPRLYRPSYGCRWLGLRSALQQNGLTMVMWTVIGLDWKRPAREVAARLVRGASNGAIFCLHDHPALLPQTTLEAVRIAVPELRRRGYRFAPAGELVEAAREP